MEAVEQTNGQQVVDTSNQIVPQMTVGAWILTFVLLAIPLVNIIMMFIWAFDRASQRRNFARAYLIIFAIMIVLWIIAVIVIVIIASSSGIFETIFQ